MHAVRYNLAEAGAYSLTGAPAELKVKRFDWIAYDNRVFIDGGVNELRRMTYGWRGRIESNSGGIVACVGGGDWPNDHWERQS
jgi:hypothetical protein